jgi:hypothetical protein
MGPLVLQDKPHATASGCRENRSLGPHVRSTIRQSSGRGRSSSGRHVRGSASQEWRHGTRRRPRDMPLAAERSRHVAVVIREVRVGRVIAVSPRQQCPVVVAILVALALLWATGSLGAVHRWLVVPRSHPISRAVCSETACCCCRSSELISRVFMNHVLFGRAKDFS